MGEPGAARRRKVGRFSSSMAVVVCGLWSVVVVVVVGGRDLVRGRVAVRVQMDSLGRVLVGRGVLVANIPERGRRLLLD